MKYSLSIIMILSVITWFTAGCKNVTKYEKQEWTITANPGTSMLIITNNEVGEIINQVRLNLKKGNKVTPLSEWTIMIEQDKLIIDTEEPRRTHWEIGISDSAIDVACSNPEAFITGIAPAGENRIPARIENQYNGIIYTQMGYVSANNIYNLFDMPSDIMIRFTKESRLIRNEEDNLLMNVNLPVRNGNEISIDKNYYNEVIGQSDFQNTEFRPIYKPIPNRFKTAPVGWSSRNCYSIAVSQNSLVAETDALAKKLKPYGLEYVLLDAGYTRGELANWLEWNKEMYPDGGRWWFEHVRKKGLQPGLGLNAFTANYVNPSMGDSLPGKFFLSNSTGSLSKARYSSDTTIARLDYTNPEVIEKHLKPLLKTLVDDWGLAYLKEGDRGKWMEYFEENNNNAFDPKANSRKVYLNALNAIREVMGKENYLEGGATREIGLGFGFFDGSQTCADDEAQWPAENHRLRIQNFFSSLFGANWLNGICWWSHPREVLIKDPMNMEEAKTIVSSISLSGQAYIISDFIAEFSNHRLKDFLQNDSATGRGRQYPDTVKSLSDEKLRLYRETMPTMPIKAIDLYPFKAEPTFCPGPKEYPRALNLKVNAKAGRYDVVTLYNWEDQAKEKVLDLHEDLGLGNGTQYLVFDFWKKKLSGISSVMIKEKVPAHGTTALIVKEISENPQLLATSRHLTAAFSIQEINWDGENNSLTGISTTVADDLYKIYIHVPENFELESAQVDAKNLTSKIGIDRILEIGFKGKGEPVEWEITFK